MLFSFEITCRLIIHASRHIVAVTTSKWRVTSLDGYVKGNRLLLKRWDYHGDRWQSSSYPKVNWLVWMLCGRICEQMSCFCVSVQDEIKKVCSRQPEILKAQRGSVWMGDCEMYTGAQACIKGFWLQYETAKLSINYLYCACSHLGESHSVTQATMDGERK